jgi:hypothetical protein
MILIFVDTECGKVSEHFEFATVPSQGDVVFIQTESEEIKLRVKLVEHYPKSKGDVADPMAHVTLQCEIMPHV